jgi:hypothetical protein
MNLSGFVQLQIIKLPHRRADDSATDTDFLNANQS